MRNRICFFRTTAIALLLGLSGNGIAQTSGFSLSSGIEYTNGDYGGSADLTDVYVPFTARYSNESIGLRLTVPYLEVESATIITTTDSEGETTVEPGPNITENGIGDIVGGITFYDLLYSRKYAVSVDLTAKVKFATADEDKGLGTGEQDYSIQADVYQYFDSIYLTGSAGYKVRGDTSDTNLNNSWFGSIGAVYTFTSETRAGVSLAYRQSAFDDFNNSDDLGEFSAFVSFRPNNDWKLMLYGIAGLSDSSPDWGAGTQLKRYF